MQCSNSFYDDLDINKCISFYKLFMNHAFKNTACPGENETLLLKLSILLGKHMLVISEFTTSFLDKKAFKSLVALICTQ